MRNSWRRDVLAIIIGSAVGIGGWFAISHADGATHRHVNCAAAAHEAGYYQGEAVQAAIPHKPPFEAGYRAWAGLANRLCGKGNW